MSMWNLRLEPGDLESLGGKTQLAKLVTGLTFDSALPQPWLDAHSDNEAEYRTILEGVVWAYDHPYETFGRPLILTEPAYSLLLSKGAIPGASDGSNKGRVVQSPG